MTDKGIIVESRGKKIALDPGKSTDADVTFVSHAHIDHLHTVEDGEKVLASAETFRLAGARGYSMKKYDESPEGFELIDSGHILGSKGLLIHDRIFYTGDISVRDRAFLKGAKVPKCDILILESTYGKPEFKFPNVKEVTEQANRVISNLYSHGIPIILMGYPLGKAQVLASLFKHWEPMYVHDSVYGMNKVYSAFGVDLGNYTAYSKAEENNMLPKKPWVMIAPRMGTNSKFVMDMRDRYSAATISFSGWAVTNWYKYSSNSNYSLPLSDHCDFNELISIAKACNPSKVYTFHGYAAQLAMQLNKLGYDSEPLARESLLHYMGG
jgi:putative mRNA 3-end processing factor